MVSFLTRIKAFFTALFDASVWSRNAFPERDAAGRVIPRYMRRLVRVWLPLYDVIIMFTGFAGVVYGSPILFRLYDPTIVDISTSIFLICGVIALLGVGFPRLELFEAWAKLFVFGMIIAYIISIIFFGANADPNWFVVGMLGLGIPLILFRLDMIADNSRRRRQDAEAVEGE